MANTTGMIVSGAAGAFFGSAGGEICSQAWEETRQARSRMSYCQMSLAVVATIGVALLVVGGIGFTLHAFGFSTRDILTLAGSAIGDMAGVGLAFAVPFVVGMAVRKGISWLQGPAPKLVEEHFAAWNGKATAEERASYKKEIVIALERLDGKTRQRVVQGLKARGLDLTEESETSEEYSLWLSGHPSEMARLLTIWVSGHEGLSAR